MRSYGIMHNARRLKSSRGISCAIACWADKEQGNTELALHRRVAGLA